ncbi:MAG: hypothetical protein KC561_16415 [Myxococcales bacterium]|nr:hypothetical protein [Myxococcales bacterium]
MIQSLRSVSVRVALTTMLLIPAVASATEMAHNQDGIVYSVQVPAGYEAISPLIESSQLPNGTPMTTSIYMAMNVTQPIMGYLLGHETEVGGEIPPGGEQIFFETFLTSMGVEVGTPVLNYATPETFDGHSSYRFHLSDAPTNSLHF